MTKSITPLGISVLKEKLLLIIVLYMIVPKKGVRSVQKITIMMVNVREIPLVSLIVWIIRVKVYAQTAKPDIIYNRTSVWKYNKQSLIVFYTPMSLNVSNVEKDLYYQEMSVYKPKPKNA